MPRAIVTLRDPNNPAMPGEVKEFPNVGATAGGQHNTLLTLFNEDPISMSLDHEPMGGPKPFFSIAADLVYSVEIPDHNHPPQASVDLALPSAIGMGRPS